MNTKVEKMVMGETYENSNGKKAVWMGSQVWVVKNEKNQVMMINSEIEMIYGTKTVAKQAANI